jgi:small ligand-binding sensory domain FIST
MSLLPGAKGSQSIVAGNGMGVSSDWRAALGTALDDALAPLRGESPSLLLLFASDSFKAAYPELLQEASERSGAVEVVGCSASGVIGGGQELEGPAAIAALALRLPLNAFTGTALVDQEALGQLSQRDGSRWPSVLGLQPGGCTGLLVLVDPFSVDGELLVSTLERDYPGVPVIGGLASGQGSQRQTWVFHGTEARSSGAVVVGLGGSVALQAVVSQGAEPIGQPWTVTSVEQNVIYTIGNRPAYEVLVETLNGLGDAERRRAARNLLVGLAMDEYRDEFQRGDFLIRNLVGVDPGNGAVAVAAHPEVGQTLQFQVRDAHAADEELQQLLTGAAQGLGESPAAAVLFACNGRGVGLFGQPHHDARAVAKLLGGPPLAGLFCNGEIGPVGGTTYLHGFTASLGLVVPRPTS